MSSPDGDTMLSSEPTRLNRIHSNLITPVWAIHPLFWVGFVFIGSSSTVHPQCIDIAKGLNDNMWVNKLEAANSWLRGESVAEPNQEVS